MKLFEALRKPLDTFIEQLSAGAGGGNEHTKLEREMEDNPCANCPMANAAKQAADHKALLNDIYYGIKSLKQIPDDLRQRLVEAVRDE